jgi:hypothetical protein
MPKLKRDDVADLDVDALDEVEYDDSEFQSYGGEVPPVGTELKGFLKSLWWTRTAVKADGSGDDPMLKALWVAAENEGDEEEYNDCPFWMNLPLIPSAKFRWAPFLDVYGITLRDLKNKTYVSSDEDQFGAPIERIDTFRPGEESDDAWCRVVTGRERYDGEWQARVKSWLPWDEADEAEPEDEEEPEDGDEEYDDTEDEEEEEEQEEQEERPARGRTRSGSRSAQAAPAARPGRSGRSAPARPAAATSARSGRSSGRSAPARPAPARSTGSRAAKADTKPAARGRGRSRSAGSDEDPPF